MPNLDHACIKVDAQVACNTDSRSCGLVDNRVEHRVIAQTRPRHPIIEQLPVAERAVRQISPVPAVRPDAQRGVKIVAVPFRLNRFHSTVISIDPRSRRALPSRPVRNRETDPLSIVIEELSHFACFLNLRIHGLSCFSPTGKAVRNETANNSARPIRTTDNGLMGWWATLESNQAWVSPAELQSAAAPCSPSPILTLRHKAQADNPLTYLGQGRQSTINWTTALRICGTFTTRQFVGGIPTLPPRLD